MVNIIVGLIVVIILGASIFYIVRAKKNGVKCIGCEAGKSCNCSGGCKEEEQETILK